MATKSWHLNRRTFLRGTGVSLALPWLECMTARAAPAPRELPKRLCSIYVPFGVSLPPSDHEQAKWNWFPKGEGRDFRFTETLKSFERHRENVTVLGGLSHPNGRRMGGHDTGDIFLTGAYLGGSKMTNSVSIDQLVRRNTRSRRSPSSSAPTASVTFRKRDCCRRSATNGTAIATRAFRGTTRSRFPNEGRDQLKLFAKTRD